MRATLAIVTNPMPKDVQKAAVYAWEAEFPPRVIPYDIETLCDRVFSSYMLPKPLLSISPRRHRACGSHRQILIPKHLTPVERSRALLHESAHAIALYYCAAAGDIEPWHGPTFACTLMVLIKQYERYGLGLLRQAACNHGVKITAYKYCEKPEKRMRMHYRALLRAEQTIAVRGRILRMLWWADTYRRGLRLGVPIPLPADYNSIDDSPRYSSFSPREDWTG